MCPLGGLSPAGSNVEKSVTLSSSRLPFPLFSRKFSTSRGSVWQSALSKDLKTQAHTHRPPAQVGHLDPYAPNNNYTQNALRVLYIWRQLTRTSIMLNLSKLNISPSGDGLVSESIWLLTFRHKHISLNLNILSGFSRCFRGINS